EEPPKETAKITVVESSKGKEVEKKSIKPKAEAWTEKEQKDVMAMLERLEAEEEEEEELPHDDQKQQKEKKKVSFADHDEYDDENKKNDDEEEEDDDDWDERYDTEIADNLFSSYDDDEDYATQGIVDHVDASVYEEDEEEEEEEEKENKEIQEIEPPIIAENVSDRSTSSSSSNIEQSPLKESVTEKDNVPVNPSKKSSLDKKISTATADTKTVPDETASSTTAPPSKTKKPSRFKVARQKERSAETVAKNIAAAACQQNMEKEIVKREEEIPVVKESLPLNEKSNQPIQSGSTSSIPVVQEKKTTTTSFVPVPSAKKETKNTDDIEKGKEMKKISKFKLAREQERNVTVSSPFSSSTTIEKQSPSESTVTNEQSPSEKVTAPVTKKEKKVSKFKLTRQKARAREGGSDFVGVVVPEIPTVKDTSKKQPKTIKKNDDEDKDSKSKRKVTWDTVTTVQEHDRSAAPSTVSSDSSSPSYTAPVKEEKGKGIDTQVPLKPRTINSPADIFSALNDQRQILLDDGYPSLETGDDTLVANQESGLDINTLTKDVDLKIQDIWQFRDEAANPLIATINPLEVNNIPQVRKSKLDSNVMRGAVTERDSEEVDLDQVEQDMDLREVTSKYHSQRNSMVAAMGGYSFDPKDVYEVYDENIPSNESSVTKDTDEVEEKPRKVSRFKAARMAALENSLEEQ
ncbi:hypothetical protein INT45_013723, partial [Circinella minor]